MLDCFYHYHAKETSLVLRSAAAQQPPAAMSKQQIKSSAKLKSLIQLGELTPVGTTTTSIGIKCPESYQSRLTQAFLLRTLNTTCCSSPVTSLFAGCTPNARVTINTVYDCWCYTLHPVCDVCGRVTPDTVKTASTITYLLKWWNGKVR